MNHSSQCFQWVSNPSDNGFAIRRPVVDSFTVLLFPRFTLAYAPFAVSMQTKLAVQVFGDALQELLRQPTPPPPPARVTVEDVTGDTPVAATAAAGNPAEPSTMAGVGAAAPALAKSQVREQDRPQTPTDDWSGTRAASSASVPTVAPTSAGGDSGGGVTSATTATASSPATISVPPPSLAESSTAQSLPPPAAGRLVQSAVEGHAVVADPSLDTGKAAAGAAVAVAGVGAGPTEAATAAVEYNDGGDIDALSDRPSTGVRGVRASACVDGLSASVTQDESSAAAAPLTVSTSSAPASPTIASAPALSETIPALATVVEDREKTTVGGGGGDVGTSRPSSPQTTPGPGSGDSNAPVPTALTPGSKGAAPNATGQQQWNQPEAKRPADELSSDSTVGDKSGGGDSNPKPLAAAISSSPSTGVVETAKVLPVPTDPSVTPTPNKNTQGTSSTTASPAPAAPPATASGESKDSSRQASAGSAPGEGKEGGVKAPAVVVAAAVQTVITAVTAAAASSGAVGSGGGGTGAKGGGSGGGGRAVNAGDMVVYLTKFRRDIYLKATHWNER